MAVGVIAVLAGLLGVAIAGRGGEGAALANAQATVAGLVATARAQAAVNQTNARLVIYAQQPPGGDAGKYLRELIVVREEPAGSNLYTAVGAPVILPTPICVVPTSPVPTTHLKAGVTWNNNAATGPVSTLATQAAFSYRGHSTSSTANQFFGLAGSGRVFYLQFDSTGQVTSNTGSTPTKLALTTAVLASTALPQFNNASAVRGVVVRKTGAVSLVNDAASF